MKPPLWKHLLSYLTEIHVESAPSALNPHLYVSLSRGRYQLSTAHAVYSFGDLYRNFYETFRKLNWEKLEVSNVLLLGFGLGSIPYMLETHFQKRFRYVAVERDPNVLYLAKKYVLDGLNSHFEFHICDAARFMDQQDTAFDLICMDIFQDDVIPEAFMTTQFLESLESHLAPKGVLLYNTLSRTAKDKTLSEKFYNDIFRHVFKQSTVIDVDGNRVLCNQKSIFIA